MTPDAGLVERLRECIARLRSIGHPDAEQDADLVAEAIEGLRLLTFHNPDDAAPPPPAAAIVQPDWSTFAPSPDAGLIERLLKQADQDDALGWNGDAQDKRECAAALLARDAEVARLRQESLRVAGERMGDDAYIEGLTLDAERYRFLRSPLAAEGGPVQYELWQEMGVKLCREEAMDREVDAAMRLLAAQATGAQP